MSLRQQNTPMPEWPTSDRVARFIPADPELNQPIELPSRPLIHPPVEPSSQLPDETALTRTEADTLDPKADNWLRSVWPGKRSTTTSNASPRTARAGDLSSDSRGDSIVNAIRNPDTQASKQSTAFTSNLGRTVILNLLLTGLGLIGAGLVPFGFNLAVGHHDGAATLGHVAIALNLALLLGQIPGTISGGASKFIAEALGAGDVMRATRVFRVLLMGTLGLSLLLAAGVVGATPFLEHSFHLSRTMIFLAAMLIPAYSMYLYFKASYYGFHRVQTYLFNEILSDAAFFAVLLTVFMLGATPWLLFPFVLNNAIFTVVAIADLGPHLIGGGKRQPGELREVLVYCLLNGSGSAASLSRWALGTVIAGWFLTSHMVGLFAAAVAITAPLALLPRAISLVTFAVMARLHGAGETESVRRILQDSTEWLVFLLGIPCGLAIINIHSILAFVFGPDYVPAATATQLIIAGALITDISRPSIDGLSSTSHVRVATVASFLGLAVSIAIWVPLIPIYGINFAGLGFAVGAAVTALIPAVAAIRYLGSSAQVFVRPAVMIVGLALITVFGRRYLLVSSTIFVGLVCVLYCHLLEVCTTFVVDRLTPSSARPRSAS
jgi:O-antigen/teichoic acid export membrane protein